MVYSLRIYSGSESGSRSGSGNGSESKVLTSWLMFWRHDVFWTPWRTFWCHDALFFYIVTILLTSLRTLRTLWRHAVCLTSWQNFLTPWCTFRTCLTSWWTFWSYAFLTWWSTFWCNGVFFDVTTYLLSYFLYYNILVDVITTLLT